MNIVENVHSHNAITAHKDNRQNRDAGEITTHSLYLCRVCISYWSLLKQKMCLIGLVIVLIGPALLVSDNFRIFFLLMANFAIGAMLGFMKYKFGVPKLAEGIAKRLSNETL
jgi:hypothetical protein